MHAALNWTQPPDTSVRDFGEILTDRLGSTLSTWIDAVEFERRTLPDPNNIELTVFGWWWTRMRER
ncbi:hypothetical protein [Streptomyces sp. NRRL S-118]|uniref:hypothetical protein n=1 Tax=Streptomyces sp. NRRL S-118 TaxID=1463881 RepID=UPI000A6D392E|nr:hypothetical protein [Streptomyces sp. NRRL S-118]